MENCEIPYLRRQLPVISRNRDGSPSPQPERNFYLNPSTLLIMICFLSLGFYMAKCLHHRLPASLLSIDKYDNPGRFISENALNHVKKLTSLGPRTVGSFENEVLAVHRLSKELLRISKKAFTLHNITIDHQKASGAFSLQFLDGMTNVYRNVQNIILRIGPITGATDSILLNCHFDTVADSPGGSDDAAGCAVMLEILRVISTSRLPLKNNIIFLFNGAEENFLQGSHGFITQHKWAKDIRAFINLEACGAGAKELLFQAGPENPWLMEAYASSVQYPLANILAQEVFQAGIIPGDTDYRIFRDFGQIPGLDFAWALNGYVYHTQIDNVRQIPIESLQRTGDNILPLTIKLANLSYPIDSSNQQGNLVFFDILGFVLFRVSERTAIVINWILIVYSVYILWHNSSRMSSILTRFGCSKSYYITQLCITCLATLYSWILTFVFVLIYSQVITLLNSNMSWFARPAWLIFLYALPALIIPIWVSNALGERQKDYMSPIFRLSLRVDSNQTLWTVASFVTSSMGVRSSILISSMLIFLVIVNRLLHVTRYAELRNYLRTGYFLPAYFGIMFLPYLQFSYLISGALLIIIPLFGRSGSVNIEGPLAVIVAMGSLILFNFIIPIFSVVKHYEKILKRLWGVFLSALIILAFTPLSFPYSSDAGSPAPQRFVILHVEQKIHGSRGEILTDTGGLWIVDLDMNSPKSVSVAVPCMEEARKVDTCDTLLYCGLPYLFPVRSMLSQTHWISTHKPIIAIPTNLTLNGLEWLDHRVKRYHFTANGPNHMSLIVSPRESSELVTWSFLDEDPLPGPQWRGRNTYFVYLTYASSPEPWNFTIDLRTEKAGGDVLDIALTGHFLSGPMQRSEHLKKFLSLFPDWTVTSGWVATYVSYTF